MKVTLDTNIYVSALHFGGKPMQLLQMGLEESWASPSPDRFSTRRSACCARSSTGRTTQLRDAEAAIGAATYRVTPTETLDVVKEDPTDNRILECAVAAGVETIVGSRRSAIVLSYRESVQGNSRPLGCSDLRSDALQTQR